MLYSSEDNDFVNAKCEHCTKTLKIKREYAISTSTGFSLNPPAGVSCLCGFIHHSVIGVAQTPFVKSAKEQNVPKCPTCQSTKVEKITTKSKVGKALLWGVFAAGSMNKTFKCNNCGYKW